MTTLDRLPPGVRRFGYDRAAARCGVVHLGLGAFNRAHQAMVFEDALEAGDLRWGVTGVSLRSAGVRDALAPQDGLYTVGVRNGGEEHIRCVGAIQRVLVAPEDPAAVIAALAHPDTHLVTLTVTEKGYHLNSAGALDRDDPAVAADLATPSSPATAPGFVLAGLAARRSAGLPPFTTLSCDNLPGNGRSLRGAVLAMAHAGDTALAEWIAAKAAFPDTMVDRIVPAATPADMARRANVIGLNDRAAIATEPFWQWVVEDRFCSPRPDLAALGVQLTDDVAPWETAKLRLLNGAHSALAYLGGLAGHTFVHEATGDPLLRRYLDRLWDESGTTFAPPAALDIAAYRAALIRRFANPALPHKLCQIAADGSRKLPPRLLEPMAARARAGAPSDALALAVAAWFVSLAQAVESGQQIDDPHAQEIGKSVRRKSGAFPPLVELRHVLPINAALVDAIDYWIAHLLTRGVASCLSLLPA